ncbi:hypothetical protein BJ322DRAFT_1021471 [Thelephora terrestris]|uniref:Uncharacterized protein n=1 Tax=Thelephora terrestris TaxID=56493 RepID=A0A9P6HDD6_9AGAM|nr:hypothetical protein BJ322DRAFT_1021471 [Thelephora terrestris]
MTLQLWILGKTKKRTSSRMQRPPISGELLKLAQYNPRASQRSFLGSRVRGAALAAGARERRDLGGIGRDGNRSSSCSLDVARDKPKNLIILGSFYTTCKFTFYTQPSLLNDAQRPPPESSTTRPPNSFPLYLRHRANVHSTTDDREIISIRAGRFHGADAAIFCLRSVALYPAAALNRVPRSERGRRGYGPFQMCHSSGRAMGYGKLGKAEDGHDVTFFPMGVRQALGTVASPEETGGSRAANQGSSNLQAQGMWPPRVTGLVVR